MHFDRCRADKVIRRQFGKMLPQSIIEKGFKNKDILINGMKAKPSTQVSDEDTITYSDFFIKITNNFVQNTDVNINNDELRKFQNMIVFENTNFIIINKPAGLATQLGTNTHIAVDMMARVYNQSARLVHRIDKETSGIVVLAKNIQAARMMLYQFRENKIVKKYLAIVSNKNLKSSGKINMPILKIADSVIVDKANGKQAVTIYKELQRFENETSLIEVTPKTGRTHQIRVHMKYIGCPILGDKKYGGRRYDYMCLHASEISFKDIDNCPIHIKVEQPPYFEQH